MISRSLYLIIPSPLNFDDLFCESQNWGVWRNIPGIWSPWHCCFPVIRYPLRKVGLCQSYLVVLCKWRWVIGCSIYLLFCWGWTLTFFETRDCIDSQGERSRAPAPPSLVHSFQGWTLLINQCIHLHYLPEMVGCSLWHSYLSSLIVQLKDCLGINSSVLALGFSFCSLGRMIGFLRINWSRCISHNKATVDIEATSTSLNFPFDYQYTISKAVKSPCWVQGGKLGQIMCAICLHI